MSTTPRPVSRRERNKQDKLARITAAAYELFTTHGVDEVTTQQVAERADIGTGTLFLYARNKAELLLLVQNSAYADALAAGTRAAAEITDPLDAVMAAVRPVVECNRRQVDNGRAYLREIVFGDPEEPYHRAALDLTVQTERVLGEILQRRSGVEADRAAQLAHVVSAVMFLTMAVTLNRASTVDEVLEQIRQQVAAILPGPTS